MPCDTIVKMSIELKALNRPMLVRALEKDGWNVTERRGIIYANKDGRSIEIRPDRAIVARGDEDLVNKAYGAYNRELVRTQVKAIGGKLESVPGRKDEWKITLPQFSKSKFTQKSTF